VTALWTSFLVVALAEMGDKTQLIALAARFQRAWTIMLGILIATTLNHALAASAGVWVARRLPPAALAWALAVGFIAFGIWTLRPDEPPETSAPARWGPLLATVVVFFLAEMGDKTQLATVGSAPASCRPPG
jgi:putative Ca2+/H+ antiporter (TMEM165/GDT1 family)